MTRPRGMIAAFRIVTVVFGLTAAACGGSSSNPSNPSSGSSTPPDLSGTWTLVLPATTSSRPYTTFTVTLTQNGTALSGSILPAGTNRPTPISSLSTVSAKGDIYFGSEHAWWNDVGDTVGTDLYVRLTLDSTGNRMTGSCATGGACGSATATRTGTQPPASGGPSSMTAKIDGVTWTAVAALGSGSGGLVLISGSNAVGQTMSFALLATSTGTYPINSSTANNALLFIPTSTGTLQQWLAGANATGGGSGSVILNTLTATGASGTFSFTLAADPKTTATGTKSITEGVFNVTF